MAKLYKVVVTGPFNAGKTTFVQTLSDIDPVNTDKVTSQPAEAKIKSTTTVAMDYGRVKLNEKVTVRLFGTPGQERFEFMHTLLADGMDGFLFLIDSTDRQSLDQAAKMLALFKKMGKAPYLVVANKADRKGLSSEELREQLKLPKRQPVVSSVATDKNSVRAVVEHLITLIEASS